MKTIIDVVEGVLDNHLSHKVADLAAKHAADVLPPLRDAVIEWRDSYVLPTVSSGHLRPYVPYVGARGLNLACNTLLYTHEVACDDPASRSILVSRIRLDAFQRENLRWVLTRLADWKPLVDRGLVHLIPRDPRARPLGHLVPSRTEIERLTLLLGHLGYLDSKGLVSPRRAPDWGPFPHHVGQVELAARGLGAALSMRAAHEDLHFFVPYHFWENVLGVLLALQGSPATAGRGRPDVNLHLQRILQTHVGTIEDLRPGEVLAIREDSASLDRFRGAVRRGVRAAESAGSWPEEAAERVSDELVDLRVDLEKSLRQTSLRDRVAGTSTQFAVGALATGPLSALQGGPMEAVWALAGGAATALTGLLHQAYSDQRDRPSRRALLDLVLRFETGDGTQAA